MAGFKAKLEIEGDDLVAAELEEIAARAREAKPVMRVIQIKMAEAAREQFLSEGARGGYPWIPDKPSTVARKAREGHDTRTERRTLDLEHSLEMGGTGNIHRLSKQATTFGTRLHYARFQGHKRVLLRVTLKDADEWAERMIHYILTGEA